MERKLLAPSLSHALRALAFALAVLVAGCGRAPAPGNTYGVGTPTPSGPGLAQVDGTGHYLPAAFACDAGVTGWDGGWPTCTPGTGAIFTAGGDLSGTATRQTVVGIYGTPVSDAGPTANGQVSTWNADAGLVQWITPSSGGGTPGTGGWINSTLGTNGTCDWTAQGTATLSSDGPYSYCGTTLTKVGTSYESSPMQLTSSVGLTISPTSGSRYDTNYTAPLALIQLSSVIPNFNASTPVEVCTTLSSSLPAGDYAEGFVGLDTGSGVANNWRAGLAHNGSLGQQISMVYNGSQAFNGNLAGAADVTECMTWPSGVGVPMAVLSSSPTAYSSGIWPNTVVRLVGSWGLPTASYGAAFTLPSSSGYYAIALGAQGQGTSGYVANATATRIRFK
jgi:hypothetical protein